MKIVNPWQKLEEIKIYENAWIRVDEHKVINPAGKPGIYGKVSFKNKAIGIIPVDDQLNTWIVGQYRYTLDEYCWEIPSGGSHPGEDNLETARRELREETGIIARKWEMISRIHTSNSITDEEGFIFLARDLTFGNTDFDETEALTIKKISLKEAVNMVMRNQITDAISIAGILKTDIKLRK
jgi:8-oxo-dGTP pyrophosphatase MutT (NUDIX family)